MYILLQPLDRDPPYGRPQWRFTLFAQDEGGEGLVGYTDVQVILIDIDDNAPIYPRGIYFDFEEFLSYLYSGMLNYFFHASSRIM